MAITQDMRQLADEVAAVFYNFFMNRDPVEPITMAIIADLSGILAQLQRVVDGGKLGTRTITFRAKTPGLEESNFSAHIQLPMREMNDIISRITIINTQQGPTILPLTVKNIPYMDAEEIFYWLARMSPFFSQADFTKALGIETPQGIFKPLFESQEEVDDFFGKDLFDNEADYQAYRRTGALPSYMLDRDLTEEMDKFLNRQKRKRWKYTPGQQKLYGKHDIHFWQNLVRFGIAPPSDLTRDLDLNQAKDVLREIITLPRPITLNLDQKILDEYFCLEILPFWAEIVRASVLHELVHAFDPKLAKTFDWQPSHRYGISEEERQAYWSDPAEQDAFISNVVHAAVDVTYLALRLHGYTYIDARIIVKELLRAPQQLFSEDYYHLIGDLLGFEWAPQKGYLFPPELLLFWYTQRPDIWQRLLRAMHKRWLQL